jgi:hypothetical protein
MPPNPTVLYGGLATMAVGPKDRSIASVSGSSQLLMPANPLRKSLTIENDGANVVYVTWTKTAAAADAGGVYELAIGASISFDGKDMIPKGAIYVLGTAGQPVYAEEHLGYPDRTS